MALRSDSSSDGWGGNQDKEEKIFGPKRQEVKLNLVTESEKNDPLRSIKVDLHSILVSQQNAINGQEILYKFGDMFGYDLDPHDYNYDDIDDLLQAMPDKIEAFERDGIYTYRARHDHRVADIQSLVRRQLTKEQAFAKKRRNTWNNSNSRPHTGVANMYRPRQYQNDPISRLSEFQASNNHYLRPYQNTITPAPSYPQKYPEAAPEIVELPSRPIQASRWDTATSEALIKAHAIGTKLTNMLKAKPIVPLVSSSMLSHHNVSDTNTLGNVSLPANHRLNRSSTAPLNTSVVSHSETSFRREEQAIPTNNSFDHRNASRHPQIVKAIVKRISFDEEPKSKPSYEQPIPKASNEQPQLNTFDEQLISKPANLSRHNYMGSSEIKSTQEAVASKVQTINEEANIQSATEEYNMQTAQRPNIVAASKSMTMVNSVKDAMMCSAILQPLALEATRLVEEEDQKSAVVHMFVEMVHLFRTFLSNKADEEQELQDLIEDLLCAL